MMVLPLIQNHSCGSPGEHFCNKHFVFRAGWFVVNTNVLSILLFPAESKGLLFIETSALQSTNVESAFLQVLSGVGSKHADILNCNEVQKWTEMPSLIKINVSFNLYF